MWPSLPFTRCRSSGGRRTAVCEPTRCGFPAGPAPRVPQVSPSPPRPPASPRGAPADPRRALHGPASAETLLRVERDAGVSGRAGQQATPTPSGSPLKFRVGARRVGGGTERRLHSARCRLSHARTGPGPRPRSAPSRLPAPPPRRITDWALVACPGTRAAAKRFGHLIRFPRPWGRGAGVACSGAGVGTTGCCAFAGLLAWATT